jgi:hypothetical protein
MTNLIQTRTVIRALTLSTLLAATATAYAASPAPTSTKVAAVTSPQKVATAAAYDGNWSVVIITEKGTCDRSYRYPVRISDGTVGYAGQASFNVSGRVNPNGAVTVKVSRGDRSASGSGKLSGDYGEGSWSGGECSGIWQAERRS